MANGWIVAAFYGNVEEGGTDEWSVHGGKAEAFARYHQHLVDDADCAAVTRIVTGTEMPAWDGALEGESNTPRCPLCREDVHAVITNYEGDVVCRCCEIDMPGIIPS